MSRMRTGLAAVLALAALSACAPVGPNYALPAKALVNAPTAQKPFHEAASPAVAQAEPPSRWWSLYQDPRLDSLVEAALAANTDLRVAEANLERSQSLVEAAKAAREPDVSVGIGTSETQRSAEAFVHAGAIPVRGLYDAGFAVSYDFDLFGRLRRGIEAASAQSEVARAARDLARVNVAAETVRAYAEVCDAGGELAAVQELLRVQRDNARLAARLVQGGRGIPIDVARQEVLEAQIQAMAPGLEARRQKALYRLATLAGRPPEEFDPSLTDCRTPLKVTTPLPVGDGVGLLRRRPDIRAAERRLAAATAVIGVETATLYPNVQFGASIGSTGAVQDFGGELTRRYSLGPSVTWHVNQSVPRARIAAANAEAKAELANFDGVVLKALQETESALATYTHDLDRQTSLEAARDRARKVADTAHRLQTGGRMTGLAVLDADRTLANAQQALAANQTQISADQIAVFLALGGGWDG